jgi:drug/metabolite transporter (DMT)-like permease
MSDNITFKNEDDASGSLFDLRYLIGALFTFYGLLLVVASFFVSHVKSGDIDINLWLGLGMLILGLFFLGWARLRPLRLEGRSALAEAEGRDPDH